jgi:hypothetical protein
VRLHARTHRLPGPCGFTRAMRAFNHSRAGGEGSRDKMLLAVSAPRPRLIHILSKDHNYAKTHFHNCPRLAPGHVTTLNTPTANFSATVPSTRSGPRRRARYTLNCVRNQPHHQKRFQHHTRLFLQPRNHAPIALSAAYTRLPVRPKFRYIFTQVKFIHGRPALISAESLWISGNRGHLRGLVGGGRRGPGPFTINYFDF